MKKGKRIKKEFPIEYRILISSLNRGRENEQITRITLRTVKEFSNFRYEIVVKPEMENRNLKLDIQGLRAPQVTIPSSGPAVAALDMKGLNGNYKLVVSKLDREENVFSIKILNNKVVVLESPVEKFVEILTKETDF